MPIAERRLILAALLAASLVSTTALAQQKERNLYFQSPDGSINVIVSGGAGYVITPFPNGSGGYNGYTVSPSYPPPYSAPQPRPTYSSPCRATSTSTNAGAPSTAYRGARAK